MNNCVNKASELEKFGADSLLKMIMKALLSEIVPLIPISTFILAIGVKLRPGLSARKMSENTFMDCEDSGIPMGPLFGQENKFAKSIQHTQANMVKGIQTDAKVQSVTQAGSANLVVSAVGATGPVSGNAVNVTPISGEGIMT